MSAKMMKGGPSLNPGGRPRIAAMLDSLGLGENCREAFEFVVTVMRSEVPDPENPGRMLAVPLTLRMDAAKWIAEKRTGKASATIDVENNTNVTHSIRLEVYSEAQLEQMERLLELGAGDQVASPNE